MEMEIAQFIGIGLAAGLAIAALAVFVAWPRKPVSDPIAEARMAELQRLQGETTVHVRAMGDMLAGRQAELARHVNERLDAVTQRLGQSMHTSTQQTTEHLSKLHERLALIDNAQRNITDLASQVTSLQSVLANKQARGAFGQGRMEAIVQDGLPKGAYDFQHTLKNGKRPDCCVFLPDQRPLVIDSKFPLESVTAYREAKTDEERKFAAQRFRQDIAKHVDDIAEKYLIPGETQDMALMFVPSESVYAELHDGFDDMVQKAHRARVMLVSPTLLMLAIQVVQQIQKDARMREAADKIQAEVGRLLKDVSLLGDRVRKLQTHFNHSNEDMRQALISLEKIESRGERIAQADVDHVEPVFDIISAPMRKLEAGE